MIQFSVDTIHCDTIQCDTKQCHTIVTYNTVWHNTMWYNTVWHNTMWYNNIQCDTKCDANPGQCDANTCTVYVISDIIMWHNTMCHCHTIQCDIVTIIL